MQVNLEQTLDYAIDPEEEHSDNAEDDDPIIVGKSGLLHYFRLMEINQIIGDYLHPVYTSLTIKVA